MKLADIVGKLEKDSEFRKWRKENKDCFLAHAFMMMDKANENIWQVGYYHPKTDTITTFIIEGDDIKICPEANIFKRPDAKVEPLDISKVKIGTIQAVETGEGVMEKDYPKANPIKMFFIVQALPEEGHVFNMTFITQDFKTVNIRISAETGNVLSHKVESILDIKK
ncbi:hypothetical protein JW707_03285 [Candidatus Woesearchaeota archaeon]|nr:hypothetical protein [Candidatus Woesearchaeota archaeon]